MSAASEFFAINTFGAFSRWMVVLWMVWIAGGGASASTYYVDYEKGADSREGTTPAEAFQHCPGDALAASNAATVKLEPGDTVRFKGGVAYNGSITITQSGAPGKPIIFDGNSGDDYGTGRAIIDGSAPLADLRICGSAEEAGGNPNFKDIYWTYVPAGAQWSTINIFQGQVSLAVAQDPNPEDPLYQENPALFVKTDRDIPVTSASLKVRPLGKMGETANRPLMSMFDGSGVSAVINEINNGGELEVDLPSEITVRSFGMAPQARYSHPREVAFIAGGREVLRATLTNNPNATIEQRFPLPQPVTFRKLIVKFISVQPRPDDSVWTWGAVNRITAYDDKGVNLLKARRETRLRHATYFTQADPHFYDNSILSLYAQPATVYYKRILGYDPSRHEVLIETLNHNQIPYSPGRGGGGFSIINNVRHIDRPGEYAMVLDAERDGRHKIFVWPTDGTPRNLTYAKFNTGISCKASHIVLQRFWVRKQGWRDPNGIAAIGRGTDLVIRDINVTGLRGSGTAIYTKQFDNVLLEGCEVSDNPGHCRGIILRDGSNIVTRACVLRRNSSTALDYYTVANGVVQDCLVTENEGTHANGLTFYLGCKDILVERNTVNQGNVALTVQDGSNMIVRNNVLEGGKRGAMAVGLWAGVPFDNIVFVNNVLRTYRNPSNNPPNGAIFGGNPKAKGYAIYNNIIAGLSGNVAAKADMRRNLFTTYDGGALTADKLGDNLYQPDLSKIFVDADAGDYTLKPGSPAIDAGVPLTTLNAYDRKGVERAAYGKIDLGAYEFTASSPNPKQYVQRSDPAVFRFSFEGYVIHPPPPPAIVVYKPRFKPVAGAPTYVLKGVDFSGQGGGEVLKRPDLGGYICAWDKPGHWLEWTITNAVAGFYEVAVDHASEMVASRQVLLNGSPIPGLEKVVYPPTDGWREWETRGVEVALPLKAGRNVVRFVNLQGSLNFRKLEFIPVESGTPVE